jgi:hypothetical protein
MVVGEKPLEVRVREKAPWAPRIAIAVALSACVLTEGCVAPKHPECAFYYRGNDAKTCESVRCKLKEARKELRVLEEKEKLAAGALRAKIAAGKEYMAELETFNSIHEEMKRISGKLDGYSTLEIRIRDGKAEEGEIRSAFAEINAIWQRFLEFDRALMQISRNI